MFDRFRRTPPPVVEEHSKLKAAEIGALLAGATAVAGKTASHLADQAKGAASGAREWAGPHVSSAVDWTSPRVQKAWADAYRTANPHIEKAAGKALPVVDTAHERFVSEILPKFMAAMTAAAAATAANADKAREAASAKLSDLAHVEPPEPEKSPHTAAKVVWVVLGVAAAGAAAAAWQRSRPIEDPWAEQPWDDQPVERASRPDLDDVVTDVKHDLGDAAEHLGEAAGGAVARTREATERAKRATERAREATRKASSRRRAAGTGDDDLDADVTTTASLPVADAASGGTPIGTTPQAPITDATEGADTSAATDASMDELLKKQLGESPSGTDDVPLDEDGTNRTV